MKILISGIFVFVIWTALSGWYYVCGIKGLCSDEIIAEATEVPAPQGNEEAITSDTAARLAVPVPETLVIHFDTDQWSFTHDPGIDYGCLSFITWAEKNPDALIYISGHTDATGSRNYNLALGERRAGAVRDYFTSMGIPDGRIKVASMGEDSPVGDNSTIQGRTSNRRAEVSLKQ